MNSVSWKLWDFDWKIVLLGPQKFYLNDSRTIETSNFYRNYISILKYNFTDIYQNLYYRESN